MKANLSSNLVVELDRIIKEQQQFGNRVIEKQAVESTPTSGSVKQNKKLLIEAAFDKVVETDEEHKVCIFCLVVIIFSSFKSRRGKEAKKKNQQAKKRQVRKNKNLCLLDQLNL